MGMNYSFCYSEHHDFSGERLPKEDSYYRRVSLMAWVVENMKPTCLWRKKRRQKQKKERDQYQQLKMGKELTLEEWLLRSPIMENDGNLYNGEHYGFQHSSGNDYPSVARGNAYFSDSREHSISLEQLLNCDCTPVSADYSISLETLLKDEKGDVKEMGFSSMTGSQSCKEKKRVSFRLPEVSDTIILCSPEVHLKE